MNWVPSSLIMFISSVALYLFVRKSSLQKNSSQYNNLAIFLIPFLILISIGAITHQNYLLSFNQLIIIVIASVLFSYLGNLFSLVSIDQAPNPGYSLVISKSYVVFTTIVSVLMLNAELSIKKLLAIVLILAFSSLIMLSQKSINKTTNKSWLPLSFGAFFCWGLLSLVSKYLFSQGVEVTVFLTYVVFIVSALILLEMKVKNVSFASIKKNPTMFILIGIFSTVFNLFMMEAIKSSPNVGYVNAVNASSISLVTIFSILLFRDDYSLKKLIGVFGVTFGLILLLI